MYDLPISDNLNISALAGLFDSTTNSYKYLYFLSLLDILKRKGFDNLLPISFREIIVEILANAWYPHNYFKLYFGTQDQIAKALDSLELEITEPILKFTDTDKSLLRRTIDQNDLTKIINDFKKNVPFRLIRPFLLEKLREFNVNYEVVLRTPAIANQYFDVYKPLYRFNSNSYKDSNSIILHPEWIKYLEENYTIVRGWASWEWLNYMQQRNPSTPNVVNKLFMPQERDSLTEQKKYWKTVLEYQDIECIYSKVLLNKNEISLDHYLPWSFVAHNQLWNVIPTTKSVNSSKSNNLPSEEYFHAFVKLQHRGLTVAYENISKNQWLKYTESFVSELKVSQADDLLKLEVLSNAYKITTLPLISLATIQGFSPNWVYA
ncbi:HNH endonuclease domain-containing protein [Nostoc sp. UHCC 0252]|uniref:HNH endonuclease domain-containing protein n=1 Tax=Nostoc sp. UHCC 0252 TaxID=3110241 RepID=UPI002B1FC427|nr:HNH endonuclease domain-containing protein [Nostoc sp. UHCC 0252]MEA5600809.1 HNH endonuclease domain-containing protein [Nostoc sp. UHCC 0252]